MPEVAVHPILASLTNCQVISTIRQEDDLEGWLNTRSKGIGGSDVGSICGVSNYSSPRLVYLKKTGQYEESFSDASLERMAWGHKLEPIVANTFMERTGKRVEESPATLQHREHPWALANIDRFIVDENGKPYGILECKTAGEFMNEDWDEGDIPMSYRYQLQWYLFVTGLEYGAFACLVGGNKFYYYDMYRDDELINQIFEKVSYFWNNNVRLMIEPELTGVGADSDYVKEKYKDVEKNSEIVLDSEDDDKLAEIILDGKMMIKQFEATVEEASNKLKEKLANTEIGYTLGHIVKYSPRSQTRVDTEMLKTHFPEVYEKVTKKKTYRVLTIKPTLGD